MRLLEAMKIRNIAPDIVSYSAAISACGKCRQWEKSLELFAEMKRMDIRPNVISYNALISSMEKGDLLV